jgi:multiple sugar transport system substrate-binding protein
VRLERGGRVPKLRQRGDIVSLDQYIREDASYHLSDMDPNAVAHLEYEGQMWAVPAGIDIQVIYCNKDLFDRSGVPYPEPGWTWHDFAEKAVALRDPGAGVYGYASNVASIDVLSFIHQHGGQIVDDLYDPTRLVFDDPLAIEALTWYATLVQEYDAVLTPARAAAEMGTIDPLMGVVSGKAGMWMDDFGGTRMVVNHLRWGMAPLPRGRQPFTQAAIYGYVLSAQAADPSACWQWISFLSEQPPPGLIPARTSLRESDAYVEQVGAEAAAVAEASLEDAQFFSYVRLLFEHDREMDLLYKTIQSILDGDATPAEAMSRAQVRALR